MNTSIDVLNALDHAYTSLRIDGRIDDSENIYLSHVAILELIEAASDVLYELRDKSDAKKELIAALSRVRGDK